MLFYGISLIMKEKSNASALTPSRVRAYLIPDTTESRPRRERISTQVRMRLNPRALTSIGIEQQNPLKTKRTEENPLTYSLFTFHQRDID